MNQDTYLVDFNNRANINWMCPTIVFGSTKPIELSEKKWWIEYRSCRLRSTRILKLSGTLGLTFTAVEFPIPFQDNVAEFGIMEPNLKSKKPKSLGELESRSGFIQMGFP